MFSSKKISRCGDTNNMTELFNKYSVSRSNYQLLSIINFLSPQQQISQILVNEAGGFLNSSPIFTVKNGYWRLYTCCVIQQYLCSVELALCGVVVSTCVIITTIV